MNSKLKSNELDLLFEAMSLLNSKEEYYSFFEDLCTINELNAMGQRLESAILLHEGKTYNEVTEITGASTATISRISKCLAYGSDGYNLVIKRLKEKNEL